jgi:putative colanic acid biosynthesis acetyltransferase WcaF
VWAADTKANRITRNYSRGEFALRFAWVFCHWLVRISPRPCFGWRRMILRLFGAQVGEHVHIYPSTKILMPWNVRLGDWCALGEDVYLYSLGIVSIGRHSTVSYRSHICAGSHDLRDPTMPLLKPPVCIGDNVWIGTEAFIGPGVNIGEGAVIGARAVVVRDVPPLHIVAGNPARQIGTRSGA